MSIKEAIEFLELPATATDYQIGIALQDKLQYFEKLLENAPNDFLKRLYAKNVEKTKAFQSLIPHQTGPANASLYENRYAARAPGKATPAERDSDILAFLIRHNEGQASKTYPLYEGKNIIGRTVKSGELNAVLIDDDNYVSRAHALIEVVKGSTLEMILSDSDVSNGGKASKNGTYVNGNAKRIKKAVVLEENDTIQIGMTKLIIRYNNGNIDKIIDEVEDSNYMRTVVINLL